MDVSGQFLHRREFTSEIPYEVSLGTYVFLHDLEKGRDQRGDKFS